MSIHGICFNNGMFGRCNILCEQFQNGECEAADDVMDAMDVTEFSFEDLKEARKIYYKEDIKVKYYHDFKQLKSNQGPQEFGNKLVVGVRFKEGNKWSRKTYDYFTTNENLVSGLGLGIIHAGQKKVVKVEGYTYDDDYARYGIVIEKVFGLGNENFTESKENTMKALKDNTVKTVKDSAKLALELKTGEVILKSVNSALYESGILSEKLESLMQSNEKYVNVLTGLLLNVAAQTFSHNETIKKGAQAVMTASTVSLTTEITVIEELLESVIQKAMKLKEVNGKE